MSTTTLSWAAVLEGKVRRACAEQGLGADACQAMIADCQWMQQIEQWLLAVHVGAIVLALLALGQLARMVGEIHRTCGMRATLAAMHADRRPFRSSHPPSSTKGADQ